MFPPPSTELPKPPAPYVKGWEFTVQSHIAPPPTPVKNGCCRNWESGHEERKQLLPVERCLRDLPLPGILESGTVNLRILDILRAGDGRSAQVFTVEVLETSPDLSHLHSARKLVAKVNDPLYFNDDEDFLNPFRCVDKHYMHEVGAYKALSSLKPAQIPRFYGSYSLNIHVKESKMRSVRLILMEYIPGKSMQQVNPNDFSQSARQDIIKAVIDLDSRVYEKDIMLADLCPRNVMLAERPNFEPKQHVIFIDFADAIFGRRYDDNPEIELELFLGQYISPLLRWRDRSFAWEFESWIDWNWTPWLEREFAHTAATITLKMREEYDS